MARWRIRARGRRPIRRAIKDKHHDMLERSQALSAERISSIRQAIDKGDKGKLKGFASGLEKDAGSAKSAGDTARLKALADILRQPAA